MNVDRTIKPAPDSEISFTLPAMENFTLSNGLKVIFVKKDKLPILQLNLVINSGSKFDPENKKGLSNLCSMAIDEGAGKYNALELSEEFDTLGTNFGVYGDQDSSYIYLQTLSEFTDRSLELFSTVVTTPRFYEDDFDREKRKITVRLMQLQDEADEIADEVSENLIFGGTSAYSYPNLGYPDTIDKITISDVKDFYKKYFNPGNSFLIVVGDAVLNQLEEKLNTYLGNWGGVSSDSGSEEVSPSSIKGIHIVDKPSAVQSEIRVGHLSTKRSAADYFPKMLLNTVLGGQFTSRLNLNLREDKGYTYGIHSRFNYFKDAGYFYVSTSVGAENTGSAVEEIMKEIRGIKNGVKPEELEFAKSSLIRKFPANFETYRQIATNVTGKVLHNLPDDYFNTYLESVNSVTLEEVNAAAEKYLHPEDAVITVVGKKENILPQLEELNEGKIIEVDIKGRPVN